MKLAYKFRMYPKKPQEAILDLTLETCRCLYNSSLKSRIVAWEQDRRLLTSYDQKARDLIRDTSVHSQVLQDVLRRLDKSFKGFFNRSKNKEAYTTKNPRKGTVPDKFKPGYPRFKSKTRYKTFTYPQSGFKLEGSRLTLSKIGSIRIFKHREIEGKVKTCTIKRDSTGCWYAIFVAEEEDASPVEPKEAIGIDLGTRTFATLSTGEKLEYSKYYRKSEKRLAYAQTALSRKKKGSNNRAKARIKVAKIHKHIQNQRDNTFHEHSRDIVNRRAEVIIFENLHIHGLGKGPSRAKDQHDHAWRKFIRFVTYKAERAGKSVLFVVAKGSTMECFTCGKKIRVKAGDIVRFCPRCGIMIGRDENAALVLLKRGLDTLGLRDRACIMQFSLAQVIGAAKGELNAGSSFSLEYLKSEMKSHIRIPIRATDFLQQIMEVIEKEATS